MAKARTCMPVEMSTVANGKMTNVMARASVSMPMEINTW
jgi:hypothetical protein